MAYMDMVYKGASSNDLYTAYFDGTSWHGNVKIKTLPGGIDPQSNYNPGICLYNNGFYLVYKGADTNDLYSALFDNDKWHGNIKIKDQLGKINPRSNYNPSLVAYNSLMYAIYKGADSNEIYTAWFDQNIWYGNTRIKDQPGGINPQTNYGLNAVEFKDRLYIVYKGHDTNELYTAYFDSTKWYGNTRIKDQPGGINPQSNYNPGLVCYNDRLYLVYKGHDTDDLYSAYFDGTKWYGNTKIKDQPGGIKPQSNYNPGALSFDNKLYIVYKGEGSDDLYSAYFDGKKWYGNTKIKDQPGGIKPSSNYNPNLAILPIVPGTLPRWLKDVSDTTLIGEINLPGTHDTAAINQGIHTPYACHYNTITQQMDFGTRLLDIRMQISKSGGKYVFTTVHGSSGDGLGIGLNLYQSLSSALDECKAFLKANPTEFLAVSLKVDNWDVPDNKQAEALAALSTLLKDYPIYNNSKTIPQLKTVRGKMYLLNRINSDLALGVPIDWPDNPSGILANANANREFRVYVQDQWRDLPTFGSTSAKLKVFTDAITQKTTAWDVLLNFASATYFRVTAVYINEPLIRWFGENTAANRPKRLGWSLFDYETTAVQTDTYGFVNSVQLIVSSNFGYKGYEKKFKEV